MLQLQQRNKLKCSIISSMIKVGGIIQMKVIKRDGHMVEWCPEKVELAIEKANTEVEEDDQASAVQIKNIICL